MTSRKKTREERKQEKELEEARKAGTIAPLVDEDGVDISPHIPQYISKTPWYLKKGETPSLHHQKRQKEKETSGNQWYNRGKKKGIRPKKYRKGACTNCGAMGHNAKSCLERPRKISVKYKPENLCPDDEETPDLKLDYAASRDRWNGYDPSEYQKVFDKYKLIEEERRRIMKETAEKEAKEKIKNESQQNTTTDLTNTTNSTTDNDKDNTNNTNNNDTDNNNTDNNNPLLSIPSNTSESIKRFLTDDYEDEDIGTDADLVLKGDEDQVGTKVDVKRRTTIRNLRIREDTAKYLLNLDPNSAFYEPKTRSMRGNPLPFKNPSELEFAGENFERYTGEVKDFNKLQSYAFDATEKGQSVHMQAAPSQSELLHREFSKRKETLRKQQQQKILAKYGGEEHLKTPSDDLLLGQSEAYVEYSRDGKLVSGLEATALSKWQEDIYPGNHTSVWGSFWYNGKWGFACCYQFQRNAYCLGKSGIQAFNKSKEAKKYRQMQQIESIKNNNNTNNTNNTNNINIHQETKSSVKNNKNLSDKEKKELLEKALQDEENRLSSTITNDRKRSFNSFISTDVSDIQLEAYRIKRQRTEDPMADYIEEQRHNKNTD